MSDAGVGASRQASSPITPDRLLALAIVLTGVWLGSSGWFSAPPPRLNIPTSRVILDREARLLRVLPVAPGRVRLPVELAAVDRHFLALLLAVEDRRFFSHPGVDPLALARAGYQLLTQGRIVSGGSTLTMQLARLLTGSDTRTLLGKLRQIRLALALERRASKAELLAAYLTCAPYGGNIEGVRAASWVWFGKEPQRLTAAEAALLVALPQAPEARRPDRHPETARRARDRLLARALALGVIDAETAAAARRTPVPTQRQPLPQLAFHTSTRLARAVPEPTTLRLTLDALLQSQLESLAAERAAALGATLSLAILVADHRTEQVLAAVGAADWRDPRRQGHVDMTRARRSPGSTLKPLIYGLAFELGLAQPESLIEDRPAAFAGYAPTNFDRRFRGTVTVRQALIESLNVPAVRLLDTIGPAPLVARLRRAGTTPVLPDLSPPGLAIGLGGIGLSLTDLVRLYGAFARGGQPLNLSERWSNTDATSFTGPVLDAGAAWLVGAILRETPAAGAPEQIAFKTGTSYGYRDAWAIGWDGRHVVGVWVGRPDGAPVPGLTGSATAAPLLIEVFARLGPPVPPPPPPPGVALTRHADLPPPLRHARVRGTEASSLLDPEIAFPPDGVRLELTDRSPVVLKVRNGIPPFTWLADGVPIAQEPFARTVAWTPAGPGYTVLTVLDGRGRASRARVYLDGPPRVTGTAFHADTPP